MYLHLPKTIVLSIVLIFLFNSTLLAQSDPDSTRIVELATHLIQLPEPQFSEPYLPNMTPKTLDDLGLEQIYSTEAISFVMDDGVELHAKKYTQDQNTTVLLVHGTLGSSFTMNRMSGLLGEALKAEVIAIDLRGHGLSGGTPGDISTPNQYAEDLYSIIKSIKDSSPEQKIMLAGHSMGGGIILRFVETFPQTLLDGYLLFAPNLGNTSPTSSTALNLGNNFIRTHLTRGLGLKMLNDIGIHTFDSLKVVFYNLPPQMPVRAYSYRSMEASFPHDYKKALRSITHPLLVIAGDQDEAFLANEYPPVISGYSNGECYIIENETHNGIRHNERAMDIVKTWGELMLD